MEPIVIRSTLPHAASILFLHGMNGSGHVARALVHPLLQSSAYRHVNWIFPTAPRNSRWYDILGVSMSAREDESGIEKASAYVHSLIDKHVEESKLDSTSVILSGVSQGGALALHAALTYEKPLGGVLAINSYIPMHRAFMLHPSRVKQSSTTPIVLIHGEQDQVVPHVFGKMSYMLLKMLGMNAEFVSMAGLDHYSTNEDFWIQVKQFFSRIAPNPQIAAEECEGEKILLHNLKQYK